MDTIMDLQVGLLKVSLSMSRMSGALDVMVDDPLILFIRLLKELTSGFREMS
jgi:hypothetical protein